MPRPRLILLPGLGADHRLFHPQLSLPANLEIPPSLPPLSPAESLSSYAQRFILTLQSPPPFLLAGVSFGGILAQQIAHLLPPSHCQSLILISSCLSNQSLPLLARAATPLLPLLPARLISLSNFLPLPTLFGLTTPAQSQLFSAMLKSTPTDFLRWSLLRAATWPGIPTLPIPLHQIHGQHDHILHPPSQNATLLPTSSHLINLTHPDQVNQFIMTCINPSSPNCCI